jgi:hypothetical protein
MKRWLATIILVLACAHSARAQKYEGNVVLGIQSGVGIAVASYSHDYTISVPFTLQMDFAIRDGSSIGIRTGYQLFNTEDFSTRNNMKIAQIGIQGKQFFSPDIRTGLYGIAGWGVFWYKEDLPGRLSDPAWGGFGGLGIHYEATDEIAFYTETVFNLVFANPDKLRYLGVAFGVSISVKEE